MKRALQLSLFVATGVLLWVVGRPLLFVAWVWMTDPAGVAPTGEAGRRDVAGLDQAVAAEVIAVAADTAQAEAQLAELVRRAAREGRVLSIGGAQHTMGGHTLYPGGIALDLRPFKHLSLDADRRILTAGAGARWSEVIPYLDRHGLAVAVMQSNNDFTVGGSISVNCHGWQHGAPPIASTVDSFRLLRADGRIVRCSRDENPELFRHALGGYGLFGVVLDVDLRVVPNEFYRAEWHPVRAEDFAREYRRIVSASPDIGLAYGRLSVAPESFLAEGLVGILRRTDPARPAAATLAPARPSALKRAVFRGSVGSDYGKKLRWRLEKAFGQMGRKVRSRNQVMNESWEWFASHDPRSVEILHEYFIPCARLAEFLARARPAFARHRPDLLNVTVREVQPDADTALRYAREPVFGLVMLYHHERSEAADAAMAAFTRELIDAALACGGTYYLPYRPHATREQFLAAYPDAPAFAATKLRHDPQEVFRNQFYRQYLQPLVATNAP